MSDQFDEMAQDIAQSDEENGYFEDESEWPNCPTPDCEWKVNKWGGLGLCSPCSERVVGKAKMQRRYEATRISEMLTMPSIMHPACIAAIKIDLRDDLRAAASRPSGAPTARF